MHERQSQDKQAKILALLHDKAYVPMKLKELAHLMGVPESERPLLQEIIEGMLGECKIIVSKKGKIMLPEAVDMCRGVFIGHTKGFGFVVREDDRPDIFIPARHTNGAMNKDTVLCKIIADAQDANRAEGDIIRIIKRGYAQVAGTYESVNGYGFVSADDKKIPGDIFIAAGDSMGAVTGHKVSVKITKSAEEGKNAQGVVTEIIGHKNDPGVDISSVVRLYDIPVEFDTDVYAALEKITEEIPADEIASRRDFRDIQTITIDGTDTKDVDDAVTLDMLPNGHFRLGVHIADVSHYVRENDALDREAYKRGTSVYLVDRVIPMLPHKLSNGVCSLNPGVDRLSLSCVMDIDEKGAVVSHEIVNSVVRVDKPIHYDQVYEILTDAQSPLRDENEAFLPLLERLETLCGTLREKRVRRGAIEFDFPEAKIRVDENGKPIQIMPRERNIATSIIEECMLVCNETVAEEYYWLALPFVFRSHEEPDSEKMNHLSEFVSHFGYHLKGRGAHPGSLQALLSKIERTSEELIISRVMLRSLKQARYTRENMGHFGLAAKYYCHFTSPIRRYPDLQIHRIIKEHLKGEDPKRMAQLEEHMPEICKQCSVTERAAESCEREVENMKKVEFMSDKISHSFEGIISGVTGWGIYVELPNTIEGMVSLASMTDDYYVFHKDLMCCIGERNKRKYTLGDKVTVIVNRVNVEERTLDFIFG